MMISSFRSPVLLTLVALAAVALVTTSVGATSMDVAGPGPFKIPAIPAQAAAFKRLDAKTTPITVTQEKKLMAKAKAKAKALGLNPKALEKVKKALKPVQQSLVETGFRRAMDSRRALRAALSAEVRAPTQMKISYLDCGHGDATLIQYDYWTILIDTGLQAGHGAASAGWNVATKIKALGVASIDFLIITHPHADHFNGVVDIMAAKIPVANLVYPGAWGAVGSATAQSTIGDVIAYCVKAESIAIGASWAVKLLPKSGANEPMYINVKGGSKLYKNPNNISLGTLIRVDSFSALFTGDSEKGQQKHWLKDADTKDLFEGPITVFHAPHHGAQNGLNEEFLAHIQPALTIVSTKGGVYPNNPHLPTVAKYKAGSKHGALMTKDTGTITVTSTYGSGQFNWSH